jgi:D-glycero-D-manno-heptose 1,7-bisphosphate phosphatase|tara:strand:+ start:875 stop:1432 length:558 start_codon:yes stop_codon:yes gene_type:complete
MSRKALFLDRDGVINVNYGYVHKVKDFDFVNGIFDLTRAALAKNYIIFVVTNQAGIGRGYYSEKDFHALTGWMCARFRSEGVLISKVYYSPYHPTHGVGKYKKNHNSRKPQPGMLLQAINEFNIDAARSILIGDQATDIQAAMAAGLGTKIYLGDSDISQDVCIDHYRKISSLSEAEIFLKDESS